LSGLDHPKQKENCIQAKLNTAAKYKATSIKQGLEKKSLASNKYNTSYFILP